MNNILRVGDSDTSLRDVRAWLSRLGYNIPTSEQPQLFEPAVERALRHFQQDRGITADGLLGPSTFRRLEEARWRLGDRVLTFNPSAPMTGEDVTTLQRRLLDLGFRTRALDGVFSQDTDRALREFQRNYGLSVDGICGTESLKALDRLSRTVTGGDPFLLLAETRTSSIRSGIHDKVIVIDPGVPDNRAPAELQALDLTHDLASRVEGRLAAIGGQIILTRARGAERERSERRRAEFANTVDADVVLSIHLSTAETGQANGVATYYYGNDRFGHSSPVGCQLAAMVHDRMVSRTDLLDCRIHPKTSELLRLTKMPTVRVEVGYLTHPGDAQRLQNPQFRDTVADALASSMVDLFRPDRPEE